MSTYDIEQSYCKIEKLNDNLNSISNELNNDAQTINGWNDDMEMLLIQLRQKAVGTRWMHFKSSKYYYKRHLGIGVPTTILATFTSMTAITTYGQFDTNISTCIGMVAIPEPYKYILYVNGVLMIIVAPLSALQTFLDFKGLYIKHRAASKDYSSIIRLIQQQLAQPDRNLRKNCNDFFIQIIDVFDKNVELEFSIPNKYLEMYTEIMAKQGHSDQIALPDMVLNAKEFDQEIQLFQTRQERKHSNVASSQLPLFDKKLDDKQVDEDKNKHKHIHNSAGKEKPIDTENKLKEQQFQCSTTLFKNDDPFETVIQAKLAQKRKQNNNTTSSHGYSLKSNSASSTHKTTNSHSSHQTTKSNSDNSEEQLPKKNSKMDNVKNISNNKQITTLHYDDTDDSDEINKHPYDIKQSESIQTSESHSDHLDNSTEQKIPLDENKK